MKQNTPPSPHWVPSDSHRLSVLGRSSCETKYPPPSPHWVPSDSHRLTALGRSSCETKSPPPPPPPWVPSDRLTALGRSPYETKYPPPPPHWVPSDTVSHTLTAWVGHFVKQNTPPTRCLVIVSHRLSALGRSPYETKYPPPPTPLGAQ